MYKVCKDCTIFHRLPSPSRLAMTTILAEVYANVSSLLATPSTILGVDTTAGQILAAVAVIGPISYAVYSYILSPLYLSPLSKIPGPPVGWIPGAGNFVEITVEEVSSLGGNIQFCIEFHALKTDEGRLLYP